MNDITGDFLENLDRFEEEFALYSTDYTQEDEDTCDVCKNSRPVTELRVVEADEHGGQVQVCEECIEKGWAEE